MAEKTDGSEKSKLLQSAIDHHSDCMFGDGVQVGAWARYLLGSYYKENDDAVRAALLFAEIKKDYPLSIDHDGEPLEKRLPKD